MNLVITISIATIAVCMVLIMFGALALLLRLRRLVLELEKFVDTARINMPPLIHDVTQITSDVRSIVRTVEREMPKFGKALESVRETADEVHQLERAIRQRIQGPLLGVASVVGGVLRGFTTFFRTLLR